MDNFYMGDRHIIESGGASSYPNTSYDESKMEVVKAFNSELVSLYDIKPPISKAKMTAITKAAMKSVKFYKHVVHGVEKFILKCRPDYKIPGLYVIDSIVRQSRHQFGVEKDVFAPRFSKNLLQTFKNICLCPEEDKQKLVRVINLWQKHKVFPEDLLKKFLVMAEASEDDLPDLYKDEIEAIQKSSKKSPTSGKKKKKSPARSGFDTVTTPVQNSYYSNNAAPRTSSTLNDNSKNSVDPNIIQQLQTLTTLLQQSNVPPINSSPVTSVVSNSDQVKFDKKLLDYDYGEEEEETGTSSTPANAAPPTSESITSILTNPDILRQLQTLQVQLSMAQQVKQPEQPPPPMMDQQRMMMNQQMPPMFNPAMLPPPYQQEPNFMNVAAMAAATMQNSANLYGGMMNTVDDDLDDKPEIIMEKKSSDPLEVIDLDRIATPPSDRSARRSYSRSRSRSSSRSPRSRSRRGRSRRSRSRSWGRDRSRDRERNDDRRRRALPPIKRKHLAVCSTTLWVGHLSKLVQEQDLSDTFGQYGDIVSIDLIPPRGCAFLCMNRRQDADRALHRLKNLKIHGKAITIAWAPGKGMKGREWKDYWEVDYGVSYIPWSKLSKDTDFDLLEEGGMLDQETMPDWLKAHLEEKRKISYGRSGTPRALYTPSGTDMDESDNDDMTDTHNTDMIIETTNGLPEQMIPLPDGPQPNAELQPPLGIPLPPGQNPLPPPPNLLNPFNLPPRLLAPVGVLGGNFLPPLGVPPPGLLMSQQQMVNRLPPPFPGPPGLPMLNPGPGPNPSLAQIPLPDSGADTSGPNNEFKPPPFGLTPPLMFPGNPNIKIDLPGNPLGLGPGNTDLGTDDLNADKNPFVSPFKNLPPFNPPDLNSLKRDFRNEDIDYRIPHPLGDMANARPALKDSNPAVEPLPLPPTHPAAVNNLPPAVENHGGPNDEAMAFNRERHAENEYDRERYAKFQDRNRNFEQERDRFHDRNHRFGGGRSPYREDGFENDRRDAYRRSRFERDFDRDYKRGGGPAGRDGRDFRGGRGREPSGASSRFRPRSRERDRDRDRERDRYRDSGGRRDFGAENESRRRAPYDRHDRNADASMEDSYRGGKRSRWSDANAEQQLQEKTDAAPVEVPQQAVESANDSAKGTGDNTWLETTTTTSEGQAEGENNSPQAPPATEDESKTNNTGDYDSNADESNSEHRDENYCSPQEPRDEVKSASQLYNPEEDTAETSTTKNVTEYSDPYECVDEMNKDLEPERRFSNEILNESMDVESEENSQTELNESTRADTTCDETAIRESVPETTMQAVTVSEARSVNPPPKKSNTFDMFADDDEEAESPASMMNEAAVGETQPPQWVGHQETTPLPFLNAVQFMEQMSGPPPAGPFSGLPDMHRSPFSGQQPHLPPFLMQPPPRHFSPFADTRPPRPYMPSRSNNF